MKYMAIASSGPGISGILVELVPAACRLLPLPTERKNMDLGCETANVLGSRLKRGVESYRRKIEIIGVDLTISDHGKVRGNIRPRNTDAFLPMSIDTALIGLHFPRKYRGRPRNPPSTQSHAGFSPNRQER